MGKRWDELEDAILLEISKRRHVLLDEMHRLPGRTYNGARKRASVLEITFRVKPWSDRERLILRRIYRSDDSIKAAVARLLPDRTYVMAKSEAQRLGISGSKPSRKGYGYSTIFRGIERLLAGGRMESMNCLASELGVTVCGVRSAIKHQHGKRIRVGDYRRVNGGGFAKLWVLGAGPDAPRPARKSAKDACRSYRERQRIRSGDINPFAGLMTSPQQVSA
ncbi:hypothetical protein [Paraburkholderia sp. GAS82]|uniref:hypothetical protein n=1 Tax=Paraburkholderia sp. GAS82 TaxID=3035137 RepID=UPI003D22DE16